MEWIYFHKKWVNTSIRAILSFDFHMIEKIKRRSPDQLQLKRKLIILRIIYLLKRLVKLFVEIQQQIFEKKRWLEVVYYIVNITTQSISMEL